MNSPFVTRQAEAFADRLFAAEPADEAARLGLAYRLAFGREAAGDEAKRALGFIAQYAASAGGADASRRAWAAWCQAVFASNEFVYLN